MNRWRPWLRWSAATALATGCGAAPAVPRAPAPAPPPAAAVSPAVVEAGDLTAGGARLVPLEPGGRGRWIAHGVRVLEEPGGAAVSALDRLATSPSIPPVEVPERLGGGFLYALGTRLWRSDSWLGPARPIASFLAPLSHVWIGLDRAYCATNDGALGAVDPRTGALLDRGPLPAAPSFTAIAGTDAWRAVALADLRGPLLTVDAGASWRPVPLPVLGVDLAVADGAVEIAAFDGSRWELRGDGAPSREDPAAPSRKTDDATVDVAGRLFRERPLAAAVAEGWPMGDGTAVVARDGMLARVRLADGALVALTPAFPAGPARCHPLDLGRPGDPRAFGFVCGAPGGATHVYRGAAEDHLVEVRRFERPREVLAYGNGALAVRGACAGDQPVGADAPGAWCLMDAAGTWRDLRLEGDDAATARLVALSDGRVALVRAPRGQDLSTARLTLTGGAGTTDLPLRMPELRADATRALREGMWLDGFEERRPGVLGGWVSAGSTMLGVEIALDGQVRVGEYLREAADPFVAGRWGFAWTASRRGFETTDGGMTWTKDLDLPEPLLRPRQVPERACGPVGCLVAGWIRVGWGATPPTAPAPAPRAHVARRTVATLDLSCEPAIPARPTMPRASSPRPAAATPHPWGTYAGERVPCRAELAPFDGQPAASIPPDTCGVQAETTPMAGLAQVTAWGPRSGEWVSEGRWSVAWTWHWGGASDSRRTAPTSAPWPTREDAARYLGLVASPISFGLLSGDDADHALLVGRSGLSPRTPTVVVLETGGAAAEVRWAGGEPIPDVLAATRLAGLWYVATSSRPTEPPALVLWVVEAARGRELARLPRAIGAPSAAIRLAHRSHPGAAVGVVIDGQPSLDRGPGARWVAPIDAETGGLGELEPLFALDATPPVPLCTGDDEGWVLDAPYGGPVRFWTADGWREADAPSVRERLTRDRGCVERVEGGLDRDLAAAGGLAAISRGGVRHGDPAILASVHVGRERTTLRCTLGAR